MVTTSGPVSGPAGSLAPIAARSLSSASVASTLRCAQVVPCAVTTHGVDAVQAVLDQRARRVGQMLRGGLQNQRAGCGGQSGPIDVRRTDVGDGVRRTQREAGIRRHRGAGGQAGQDLEEQLGAGHGVDLGEHRVDRQRVTGDQPDHVGSQARLVGQDAGDLRGIAERRAGCPGRASRPAGPARRPAAHRRGPAPPSLGAAGGSGAGAGPDAGGSSEPTIASTCSGTSGSVNTSAALASTVRARVVSRPGSPGPDPTNRMRPGFALRPRMLICITPALP